MLLRLRNMGSVIRELGNSMEYDVTVIIPVYNVEIYIEKCIRSVLMQTLKNIEIICVDDGSSDNSWNIIDKMSHYDSRIIAVKHEKNMNQASAKNTGLNMARGKYISFIDSDDWIHKDFLYTLYNSAEINNADIAIGYGIVIDEKSNNWVEVWGENHFGKLGVYNRGQFDDLFIKVCYNGACWNKIYRRIFIKEKNIQFDTELSAAEDQYFMIMALTQAQKISICDAIYFYIKRISSTMTRKDAKFFLSWSKTYSKIVYYLNSIQINPVIYHRMVDMLTSNTMYWYHCINDKNISEEFKKQVTSVYKMLKD